MRVQEDWDIEKPSLRNGTLEEAMEDIRGAADATTLVATLAATIVGSSGGKVSNKFS